MLILHTVRRKVFSYWSHLVLMLKKDHEHVTLSANPTFFKNDQSLTITMGATCFERAKMDWLFFFSWWKVSQLKKLKVLKEHRS